LKTAELGFQLQLMRFRGARLGLLVHRLTKWRRRQTGTGTGAGAPIRNRPESNRKPWWKIL